MLRHLKGSTFVHVLCVLAVAASACWMSPASQAEHMHASSFQMLAGKTFKEKVKGAKQ